MIRALRKRNQSVFFLNSYKKLSDIQPMTFIYRDVSITRSSKVSDMPARWSDLEAIFLRSDHIIDAV